LLSFEFKPQPAHHAGLRGGPTRSTRGPFLAETGCRPAFTIVCIGASNRARLREVLTKACRDRGANAEASGNQRRGKAGASGFPLWNQFRRHLPPPRHGPIAMPLMNVAPKSSFVLSHRHLLGIEGLSRDEISGLLDLAEE